MLLRLRHKYLRIPFKISARIVSDIPPGFFYEVLPGMVQHITGKILETVPEKKIQRNSKKKTGRIPRQKFQNQFLKLSPEGFLNECLGEYRKTFLRYLFNSKKNNELFFFFCQECQEFFFRNFWFSWKCLHTSL